MKNKFGKNINIFFNYFHRYITFYRSFFYLDYESLFYFKNKRELSILTAHEMLNFFILGWYSYFLIALKIGSVISEFTIFLARVLSISKLSTSLMKCLLKISASSSLLLRVLLLSFKIKVSLWKVFSEERGWTAFQNFLLSETTLWSTFPKKEAVAG